MFPLHKTTWFAPRLCSTLHPCWGGWQGLGLGLGLGRRRGVEGGGDEGGGDEGGGGGEGGGKGGCGGSEGERGWGGGGNGGGGEGGGIECGGHGGSEGGGRQGRQGRSTRRRGRRRRGRRRQRVRWRWRQRGQGRTPSGVCPAPPRARTLARTLARALVGSCVWRSAPSLSRPSACSPLARFAFEVKHRPSAPHRAPAGHEKSTNGDATPGWRRPRGDTREARALVGEQAGYAAAVDADKLPVRGDRRRGGATSAMQVEGMDAFERSKTWRTVVHLTCPRQRALGAAADSAKLGEVGRSARASRATATSARSREGHSGH